MTVGCSKASSVFLDPSTANRTDLSHEIMALSPSVNSIFKHACAAIHWRYTSDFWSDPSSTSILYV